MEIKLDSEKMADIIKSEVSELLGGIHEETEIAVGEYNGAQVLIRFTKDEYNMHEEISDVYGCIEFTD